MLERKGGQGVRMGDIAREAGVSRQAVYLHFASRTELLVAALRHVDESLGLERRLAPSRAATGGRERLCAFVAFWAGYVPDIHVFARAILLARASDADADAAWCDRMAALRDGCQAAVAALAGDGALRSHWTPETATDALWALLQVPMWEHLRFACGWSEAETAERWQTMAMDMLVAGQSR
ncbi:MAG: helix-turn-helix transcriptional regulator [Rhodocyclaceae bacterium]|nr:helix-turn-helix transcriptional regulator [Rhodocyclaceae bacterium]